MMKMTQSECCAMHCHVVYTRHAASVLLLSAGLSPEVRVANRGGHVTCPHVSPHMSVFALHRNDWQSENSHLWTTALCAMANMHFGRI